MVCISGRTQQQIRYQRHLQEFVTGRDVYAPGAIGDKLTMEMSDATYLALMYSVGFSREQCQRELEKAIDLRSRWRNGEQIEFGDL